MTIGDQILDLIIKDGLVRAQSVNGVLIFIWQGNAAEQLEALVEAEYQKRPLICDVLWQHPDGSKEPLVKTVDNIMACLSNKDRLGRLSHRALVDECLESDAADYDIVVELMNRVLPGWEK